MIYMMAVVLGSIKITIVRIGFAARIFVWLAGHLAGTKSFSFVVLDEIPYQIHQILDTNWWKRDF